MFTMGPAFRAQMAALPPLLYDWETGPTSLAFSASGSDSYFTFAGIGIGGSMAGVLECNGGPQVFNATLPRLATHYDIWLMQTNGGVTVALYNGAVPVQVLFSFVTGPVVFTEFSANASGPFDTIRVTITGALPAMYLDNWGFT